MIGYASSLVNLGANTKALVQAGRAELVSAYASNTNAAARYLLIHNKATAPVATDVPYFAFLIPPASSVTIPMSFFGDAEFLGTGLGYAISTTLATFTDAATAAEHVVLIRWRSV